MRELEVTVTVRNNRLKERRLALGLSQKDLAAAASVPWAEYANLERMSTHPRSKKDGWWRKSALMLAVFYEVEPEELFPEVVESAPGNRAVRKVDASELGQLLAVSQHDDHVTAERLLIQHETKGALRDALKTLDPVDRLVVEQRFGLRDGDERKFDDVSLPDGFGRSRERLRQRESRALRQLKKVLRENGIRGAEGGGDG